MPGLRSLLRRKSKYQLDKTNDPYGRSSEKTNAQSPENGADLAPPIPIVKIMRSTTNSQELLTAPSFSPVATMNPGPKEKSNLNQELKDPAPTAPKRSNTLKASSKRLSSMLHLNRRSRATSDAVHGGGMVGASSSSEKTPFPAREKDLDNGKTEEERQAQWEKRATLLVQDTTKPVALPPSPAPMFEEGRKSFDFTGGSNSSANKNEPQQDDDWPLRTPSGSHASGKPRSKTGSSHGDVDRKSMEDKSDDDIQLAIQLHESGDLATSTSMFGRLADPAGANNALAQVLYGLALRHGWGISPDPNLAIQYLTHSARNASQLTQSLPTSSSPSGAQSRSGKPPAGLNRGELTLAIYELGNCHRNGWGVDKSLPLAMQYFETAAELGDTDAMFEVAMAWEKGVKGWHDGKKDRFMAAKWYRRAEKAGRKEVGNSWIWKDKYNG